MNEKINNADEVSGVGTLTRCGSDLWDVQGHVDRPARRIPVIAGADVADSVAVFEK